MVRERHQRRRPARSAPEPATAPVLDSGLPFDAGFFLTHLRGFVLDRCPSRDMDLPRVEIHLADGTVLDLCHVIAVTQSWVALAVNEEAGGQEQPRMRTELVPYASILRVTVRTTPAGTAHVGFDTRHAPVVLDVARRRAATPEAALRAAAGPQVEPRGPGAAGRAG